MTTLSLHCGDCIQKMCSLPDNSIDAIVTDPPYGLSAHPDMFEVLRCWLNGEEYQHKSKGFMGRAWDSFVPGPEVWRECLRVLKPGGHMLAFFGSRTYGLGELAIRLAGFEIRDQFAWIFGSGFPKNHNVSKMIDRAKGAEREVVGRKAEGKGNALWGADAGKDGVLVTAPASPEARQWDGWGTALKPAQEPIVVCRKPLDNTVAQSVMTWGTGAINIDGCRVGTEILPAICLGKSQIGTFDGAEGGVTPERSGRWPANVILQHSHDCKVVGEEEEAPYTINRWKDGAKPWGGAAGQGLEYEADQVKVGKRPVYQCVDGCPVLEMGEQSRYFLNLPPDPFEDVTPFFYCPKPSKKERNAGLESHNPRQVNDGRDTPIDNPYQRGDTPRKNIHPTVKPLSLMRYLCRLITPPGGTVLDPFLGSGTTGAAAALEGFSFVGIEQSREYMEIAKARIAHWAPEPAPEPPQEATEADLQGSLEEKKEIKEDRTGQDRKPEGLEEKDPDVHTPPEKQLTLWL